MQDAASQPDGRCQLCDNPELTSFNIPGIAVMWHCPHCGLYQYGPLLQESVSYNRNYQAFYDFSRPRKLRTAAVRLNRVASTLPTGAVRALDIGCSLGVTVESAKSRGWDAVGVDVSQDAVALCRQQGLNCVTSDGLELPFEDESFDAVTSWHVIEHVADIRATLAEWRRVLRVGGVLAIETPDASSLRVRLQGAGYRRFWKPHHSYTFTPRTLGKFFRQAGFELVRKPVLGRLSDLPLGLRAYTVAYQSQMGLKSLLGVRKAFQIFARRSAMPVPQQRSAA